MKELKRLSYHIMFWVIIPFTILYFKWAAQDTTALPGLPAPQIESLFEIMRGNLDVIIVSLLSSIPIFYCSEFCLTPKLLLKTNTLKIVYFIGVLIAYYFVVRLLSEYIFPMYYFFGIPYAIKVLAPIILLSALSGAVFAFKEKLNHLN